MFSNDSLLMSGLVLKKTFDLDFWTGGDPKFANAVSGVILCECCTKTQGRKYWLYSIYFCLGADVFIYDWRNNDDFLFIF